MWWSRLAGAYSRQTIADVFLRYSPSRRLLEILAATLGSRRDARHLDIGFSGRLALFASLTDRLTVLNISRAQLDLGVRLLHELVAYFHRVRRGVPGSFDFAGAVPAALATVIRAQVDEQVDVLSRAGRSPEVPQRIEKCARKFQNPTKALPPGFDTATMIDVVVHAPELMPVFAEIARILARGGTAIVTYYAPGDSLVGSRTDGVPAVDEIFRGLCETYSIPFQEAYDASTGRVYPARFRKALAKRHGAMVADALVDAHWLDLPFFQLHARLAVERCVRACGLRLESVEEVPGGMFFAHRCAVAVSRVA